MLIFDSFPTRAHAERFGVGVWNKLKLKSKVYDSQEESNGDDLFPFELTPPIVLVAKYSGQFAGT